MLRVLLFVSVAAVLLAGAACSDCDCPDAPEPTVISEAQPTPEPTLETGGIVTPDADALDVPLLSESELETNLRSFHVVAPLVTIEGSSIIYSGDMHPEGYDTLVRLAEQEGPPNWLSLRLAARCTGE